MGEEVETGVCELAGRFASAIGLGAGRAFGLVSLRRPDCAVTLASHMKRSSTNETVATKTPQAPRAAEEFMTLSPASLPVLAANLLAKRPILLTLTPPGIDDGHVSYEGGGDLVLLTVVAEQK